MMPTHPQEPRNHHFFYPLMYRIRRVEETLLELFSEGKLSGTTHTCIGQESCAAGVISALDLDRDVVFSNHRAHGHFIAYCNDLEGLFAEVSGKKSGVCAGIGGSQHLCKDNFYTNGILGGTVAVATGMAFAEKAQASGAIAVVFFGDGALGEGIIYEALNIAALWQLPILFVLEHNGYAQTTATENQHSGDICGRGEQFGITSKELVADDVLQVFAAARHAVQFVRENCRPYFLALRTYRLAPHSKGDDFRPAAELQHQRDKDPLLSLRGRLEAEGRDVDAIEMLVNAEISAALASAMAGN